MISSIFLHPFVFIKLIFTSSLRNYFYLNPFKKEIKYQTTQLKVSPITQQKNPLCISALLNNGNKFTFCMCTIYIHNKNFFLLCNKVEVHNENKFLLYIQIPIYNKNPFFVYFGNIFPW